MIGAAQEKALLARVSGGDERAAAELLEAFEPLVRSSARQAAQRAPLADLLQEARIALLAAAAGYDPDKDVRFATYARPWVEGALKKEVGRASAREPVGLDEDVASLVRDDVSDQDSAGKVMPIEPSLGGPSGSRDPYLEHRATEHAKARRLLGEWLCEEGEPGEIDCGCWDYFVRHEPELLRAVERDDGSALAQLAQKYLGLPGRPDSRSHQAKELRIEPDRRSGVLAAMIAHAVEWGTLPERLARARQDTHVPGPGFWEVREFRRRFLDEKLLPPDQIVAWVEQQAAREGRPAPAYLRVPFSEDDRVREAIADSQAAYAAWLAREAERLRDCDEAELPASTATLPLALSYGLPGERPHVLRIRTDGALAALRAVTTTLLGHFDGWLEEEAVAFVVAGVVPPLSKLRARTRRGRYRAASRITLDVDPRTTSAEVAAFYERLRRRYLRGRDRLMESRGLALALFVEQQWSPEVSWPELLERWNEAHPLGDPLHCTVPVNQFATESRTSWERVSGELWPRGTRRQAKVNKDVEARRRESESRSEG